MFILIKFQFYYLWIEFSSICYYVLHIFFVYQWTFGKRRFFRECYTVHIQYTVYYTNDRQKKTLRTKLLFFTCWHQPTKQHHNIFYVPALVQSPAKTIRGSRQQLGIGLSDEEQKSGFSRNRCCQNNVYNYREHHFVPLSIKKKMNVSW